MKIFNRVKKKEIKQEENFNEIILELKNEQMTLKYKMKILENENKSLRKQLDRLEILNTSTILKDINDFSKNEFQGYRNEKNNSLSFYDGEKRTTYKDGEIILYHSNGEIKLKENYRKNKRDGSRVSYYENGNIEFVENYSGGKLIGERSAFYETGELKLKTYTDLGIKTGTWRKYSKLGNIIAVGNYKDGLKHGKFVQFHEDGKIRQRAYWDMGKEVGEVEVFE